MAISAAERLMRQARTNVANQWRNSEVRLGATLLEALLAREVLALLAHQDEDVSDARVRELLVFAHLWVQEQVEQEFA